MRLAGRSKFAVGIFASAALAVSGAGFAQAQASTAKAAAAGTPIALGTPPQEMTPLLLAVHDAPVPFAGSDGRTHMAYELWVTNFSSGDATLEKVEVLGDGAVLKILDAAEVAGHLQPAGMRTPTGTLVHSSTALLFVDLALAPGAAIPRELSHRIAARFAAAPKGRQEISETGGEVTVDRQAVVVISPPLKGEGYISADSCCDSTRHVRATLPANGRLWVSQRYAVDWEQLNAEGKVYSGGEAAREKLENYTIFGKQALAVADATVVSITDGYPEQVPGKFPETISLEEADGNSVVLDLGNGKYALYAHLQPGSVRVKPGDKVRTGQVLGLVGNTGNSLAPHLHFQVMNGPSSLASNGLPYEINSFEIMGWYKTTEEFDTAEAKGAPLAYMAHRPAQGAKDVFPLDKLIVAFR